MMPTSRRLDHKAWSSPAYGGAPTDEIGNGLEAGTNGAYERRNRSPPRKVDHVCRHRRPRTIFARHRLTQVASVLHGSQGKAGPRAQRASCNASADMRQSASTAPRAAAPPPPARDKSAHTLSPGSPTPPERAPLPSGLARLAAFGGAGEQVAPSGQVRPKFGRPAGSAEVNQTLAEINGQHRANTL